MKIAHLSDIHFFKLDFSLKSLFSKRLLGTLNYYFNRSVAKQSFDLFEIPELLKKMGVTHVVFTGDFTTTSTSSEYKLACRFVKCLEDLGFKIFSIPGNHDVYTKGAERTRRFYRYIKGPKSLEDQGLSIEDFGGGYQCIRMDTTLATPLWSSQGLFSKELEKRFIALLTTIPKDQKLIVLNHFPVFAGNRRESHLLMRAEALRDILENTPNIVLYLHGHTHKSEFVTDHPLMINSGSLTLTPHGSFHVMDLSDDFLEVEAYSYLNDQWQMRLKRSFPLRQKVNI